MDLTGATPVPPRFAAALRRLEAFVRSTSRVVAACAGAVTATLRQRGRAWSSAAAAHRRLMSLTADLDLSAGAAPGGAARGAGVDDGSAPPPPVEDHRLTADRPAPAAARTSSTRRRSPGGTDLVERWTGPHGTGVFYRESPAPVGAPVLLHLHGFGLSGRYLVPTAEQLGGTFRNLVPDLPGFGRSHRAAGTLDVPELAHAAASFLDDLGVRSATLVGNSMGCAVICEFARLHPERLDRAVLVAPAGGVHNQPLHRAVRQLARDSTREPTRLVPVAVPDYLHFGVPSTVQLFRALTLYPTLDRLLALRVPTLAVMGDRDPLMPGSERLKEIAGQQETHALLVVIEGAAHAINFSHPGELAHVIRSFMTDQRIVDDPGSPGLTRSYEIHRGLHLPPTS